jgi:hypothetical protein
MSGANVYIHFLTLGEMGQKNRLEGLYIEQSEENVRQRMKRDGSKEKLSQESTRWHVDGLL